jgi:hypothetical protein
LFQKIYGIGNVKSDKIVRYATNSLMHRFTGKYLKILVSAFCTLNGYDFGTYCIA